MDETQKRAMSEILKRQAEHNVLRPAKRRSSLEQQVATARRIYGPKPDGRIMNPSYVRD